ncbi:9839_t:CDS:2 [Ambispora leptoticha]|uniref:9839_t:CDS:1 n=1 Tax=Ambispora leptoticha TaxID=144679 RepID=A0A9N8ZB81_9GLOM|nr:9839_t:CDS:2 [Ambispora leptoticha]
MHPVRRPTIQNPPINDNERHPVYWIGPNLNNSPRPMYGPRLRSTCPCPADVNSRPPSITGQRPYPQAKRHIVAQMGRFC